MSDPLRLLLVEDSLDDAGLLVREIRHGGFEPTWERVDTAEGVSSALDRGPWDVVVADYSMPTFTGMEALALVRARHPDMPFILVSGTIGEALAIDALRAGANDYLTKGKLVRLVPAIRRELKDAELRREGREAEEALRRSTQLFQTLAKLAPVGIFRADAAERCVYFNEHWGRLAGIPPQEALGLGWRRALHPDDRERVVAAWDAAVAAGLPFRDEHRYLRPDGSVVWVLAQAVPETEGDRVVGYVGTVTDLTDRRRAEEAQQVLADATAALASSLDYEKTLEEVSRIAVPRIASACAIEVREDNGSIRALGSSPETALTVPMVIHGETIGTIAFGEFRQDLGLAEELARRAAIAVENARLYRRAQRAIAARDEFLFVASHELKTPLAAVLLELESLRRSPDLATAAEAIENAVGSAHRLSALIGELLDISQIRGGRLSLHPRETDLAELVRAVATSCARDLAGSGSRLEIDAPGPVPGRWDPSRIQQVVTNLLSNAIKYGRGRPIRVSAARDGPRARLVVRDEGIGIAESDLDRLFRPFERAAPVRHYGGLGLGLYIVRRIVEAHGGTVHAESAAGKGSTFVIELPC